MYLSNESLFITIIILLHRNYSITASVSWKQCSVTMNLSSLLMDVALCRKISILINAFVSTEQ